MKELVTLRGRRMCSLLGSRKILPLHCSICLSVLCLITGVGAREHRASPTVGSSGVIASAQSSLASGNPTEAIQVLSTHLQAHPKDTAARLLLGEAFTARRELGQAEQQYQEILKYAPDNYLALAGLGEIYDRAGDPAKAEAILAHAAKVSHGVPKVQTAWAVVLARLHRYSEASHALSEVPPPKSPEKRLSFHRLKASIAAGLGDPAGAAAEMENALALSPNQAGLQMATAAAETEAKHWERAAKLAGPLFARTHDPALGLMLLEAQLGSGDEIRHTLEQLRTLTLSQEQEVVFRQRLAEVLIAHERFSESADELKRAVELDPSRAEVRFNLALSQFKSGGLDDALATAESMQTTADSAELEDLIGDIQEARGDELSAVRSYQAAIALAPNEEKYRLSLAFDLIRHKSFEPARVVLTQAQESHSNSWRIQVALGMVEYFSGSAEEATKTLLNGAGMASDPELALRYVGDVQMDESGPPNPAALTRLCEYGDAHSKSGMLQFYCAALLFRRGYLSNDRSHTEEILRRLNTATEKLPNEASPHCQLGKAYRWIERWQDALRESETCARMEPNSPDAHYRLAQIYQHLGQQHRSEQEMKLYQTASARLADENARRDETIKTFLYSIQGQAQDRK